MMAVEMEGFSIREFALRMRSMDVVKCWPFEEVDEEDVKAMLPPITIKKFKWWIDELEMVRSNSADSYGENSRRRKKLQTKSVISDLESENVESMRVKRVRKVKPKAKVPKKRSIVELFAVAPQVERVSSDDGDEDEDEENDNDEEDNDQSSIQEAGFPNSKFLAFPNLGLNCKSKRKVKKKGLASMLEKQKKVIKNLKKKVTKKKKNKRGEDISVDIRTAKEEKTFKLPNPNCSAHSKGILVAVSTHMKKPRLKSVATEKKGKSQRTSKLLTKHQQTVLPVRGILKNQAKLFPIENSINCSAQNSSKVNNHDSQPVNKHVTFSLKDGGHGERRKTHPTTELESQNFCNLISEVTGASLVKRHVAERGKSLSIQEMKGAEEQISSCKGNEIDVQPITTMQFSGRCHSADVPNFLMQHGSQENLFNRAVSLDQGTLHNQTLQRFEGRNRGHDALYTCPSVIPSMSEGQNIAKTVPMFAYSSDTSSSSRRLLDLSEDPDSLFVTDCYMDCVKAYPQPPSSCASTLNDNGDLRCLFPSQTTRENYNDHTLQYKWLPHQPPRELMRIKCSLPDWKSRMGMFGETSINEDFVGLPLNSQGELIRLNSDDNGGFNQFRGTSTGPSPASAVHNNVLANSMVDQTYFRRWNGITSFNDQPNVCMVKDSGEEIGSCTLPSRLGILEHCGNRTNIMMRGMDPCFYSQESDKDQMNVSHIGSRQDDQVHRNPRNEIIQQQHGNPNYVSMHSSQSTMRLMGQEFKIGGRELQGREDRGVWTDKQITTEQHANTAIRGFLKSQDMPESIIPPILVKLKDSVTHLSEANIYPASRRVSQMMVPESRFLSQVLDGQNNVTRQNGCEISKGNLMPEIYPHFPGAAFPLLDIRESILQESFISGYKSPKVSQILVPSSVYDSGRNLSRSRIQMQDNQTPVHATKLAFNFPFSHSECGRDIQPPWCQSSFKVMPPWLSEARQKGTFMDFSQSYSGPGSSNCPWSISDIDYQTDPPMYPTPEPFDSFPCFALQHPFALASLAHCPLVPVDPDFLPDSALQNSYAEKMMFKNQVNPSIRARIPNHGEKTKRRLASALDNSVRPTKMPKFGIREDAGSTVTVVETSTNFECDMQCSRQALGSASSNRARTDELRVCCGMDSDKIQDAPKSGPIKLTAGARYVLNPCQKKDQTNSKPTQSTIPFATTTAAGRVFTPEKSAKFYRF